MKIIDKFWAWRAVKKYEQIELKKARAKAKETLKYEAIFKGEECLRNKAWKIEWEVANKLSNDLHRKWRKQLRDDMKRFLDE